jgi:hypothetical protein
VKVSWLRVVIVAAVLTALALVLLVVMVIRRDPYRPGTSHEVNVHMMCANLDPLVLEGGCGIRKGLGRRVGRSAQPTPDASTSLPSTKAYSRRTNAGSTIRFHRTTKQFSEMPCALP